MARAEGSVNAQLEAWLRIRAASGETVECLVDTGFNGALMLTRFAVIRLGLAVLGRVPIIGVSGARFIADIAELEVEWLNERRAVEVIISDGEDSLVGTQMLDGTKLIIDYVAHTVTVSEQEG